MDRWSGPWTSLETQNGLFVLLDFDAAGRDDDEILAVLRADHDLVANGRVISQEQLPLVIGSVADIS
jgi:hypothetical protein